MSEELSEFKAMEIMCAALQALEPSARNRAAQWLLGALGTPEGLSSSSASTSEHKHSNDGGISGAQVIPSAPAAPTIQNSISPPELTPKEFISQKNPQSVVERISCLAFYLTHHRGTPVFGGQEIEALNTEAACTTINRARDLDNASRAGYLVPAGNGKKQISSRGEEIVKALPNREAVKSAQAKYPAQRKRRASSGTKKRGTANGDTE